MTFETRYTFGIRVPASVAAVRPSVEAALQAEGFGILTDIDVAATMKAKLDLDVPPYVILGACNPALAHRALEADPSIGAVLPCNVVLRADGSGTVIEVIDPLAALALTDVEEVGPVAAGARARLERVIAGLAAQV